MELPQIGTLYQVRIKANYYGLGYAYLINKDKPIERENIYFMLLKNNETIENITLNECEIFCEVEIRLTGVVQYV